MRKQRRTNIGEETQHILGLAGDSRKSQDRHFIPDVQTALRTPATAILLAGELRNGSGGESASCGRAGGGAAPAEIQLEGARKKGYTRPRRSLARESVSHLKKPDSRALLCYFTVLAARPVLLSQRKSVLTFLSRSLG